SACTGSAATVSQSTRELALRMALGAGPRDLLRLVMVKGLALTAAAVALGFVAAFQLTRLMGYLLYHISPRDPRSFVTALVIIVFASMTACLVPALRATRTDPILALRG